MKASLKKAESETFKVLKKKTSLINRRLTKIHPDACCELDFKNPLELLVATILSAQCTDVRVNKVTKELFKEFKKPEDYINKPHSLLEKMINSTGFFRMKAKNIRGAMEAITRKHGGEVPKTMSELHALPGVGRKTANVVLGNGFGIPGLPVDTHVIRLSNRLGIAEGKDAVKLEHELNDMLRKEHWTMFSLRLIFHGRRVCKARKPDCKGCGLKDICDDYQVSKGNER